MKEREYTDFPKGSGELWNLLDQVYASRIRWGWFFVAKIPGTFFVACLRLLLSGSDGPPKPGAAEATTVIYLVLFCLAGVFGWLTFLCYRQMTPLKKGWRKADSSEINFYARHGFEIENAPKKRWGEY